MRKIRILAVVVAAMIMLTLSVSAASISPIAPAAYGPILGGGGGSGAGSAPATGSLLITPYSAKDSAPLNVRILLENAKYDLDNNSLADLVTDFAKKWKDATNGAPVENASIAAIVDVTISGPINDVTGGKSSITATIPAPGVAAGDPVLVIHKTNGTWVEEKNVSVGDGKVTVTVTSLSVFAIIVDNGAAPAAAVLAGEETAVVTETTPVVVDQPADTAPVEVVVAPAAPVDAPAAPAVEAPAEAPVDAAAPLSPQTGISGVNVAVAAAVVMAAFGSACIVKANRRHDA